MTLKKAELHVHLEGTITPSLARKLAKRNNVILQPGLIDKDESSYTYGDFMDFLKTYDAVADVIRKPDDYYDVTFEYLKSNALNGGIYIEMMYSPDHAEKASGIASREHLQAIQQAIDDAEAQCNIIGRIIITAVRHFGVESAISVAKQAVKEQQSCIVGFGLAGDEFNFPPKLFTRAYEIASSEGLHCTVHAGEFADAHGMMEAMDYLPIKRIGHGVMAMHSPETIARLIDKDIALEICPSSNISLGLFSDLKSHPLMQLMDAGIKISLNSDDPPFFKTTLANEYEKVQNFHQLSDQKMLNFTHMAIESAFADSATKSRLRNTLSSS